ncbi:MAG: transketolase C-terminal domain-containing protein, partial [Phycisphaerae bacterium]
SDPAFVHYRSGAFLAERWRQKEGPDFIRETLLSFMASSLDPIANGRHKVWGSVPLCVLPQTSTIASHLPKATGAAIALERAKRLKLPLRLGAFGEIPPDAIMVCTFGDATTNHNVAQGSFNLASYAVFQKVNVPVLYVCEDNGIGISVHTATGWIESNYSNRPGLTYVRGNGLDLVDAYRAASEAVHYVRTARKPAFLHLQTVRLLGHAGTDPETEYHSLQQIEAAEAQDPVLATARIMLEAGYMSGDEILDMYEGIRSRIRRESETLGTPPKLKTAAEVIKPLAPYDAELVRKEATRVADTDARLWAFELPTTPGFSKSADGKPRLPEHQPPRHMAQLINWALRDLMAKYGEIAVFGEDVAARGGVYYVTAGLATRFGPARVFNTLLDETSILGMAIGSGHLGMLPMPEIQYLAYLHNAIDQLRGEACSTNFFSNGQFPNPMVVRVQGLGYQKGFGGHFHNDNSIAALRDIPSLIVAVPARGDDAAKMLRTCVAMAKVHGRVVCFLEPIALYMQKDLYQANDGKWLFNYPPPSETIALGEGQVYDADASDLSILTYGNGLHMSLRAAKTLRDEHGVAARVVDLRWLSPLNEEFIAEQAKATARVLVVDEGRYSGGVAEAILAVIHERCEGVKATRLTGMDTYIPIGPAANEVLPTEPGVIAAAVALAKSKRATRSKQPA